MKLIAVALEGVLCRDPVAIPFPETAPLLEGIELYNIFRGNSNVVIVTGVTDRLAVTHWLRSNGLSGEPVEHPEDNWASLTSELWEMRLTVVDRLNRQSRGQMVLVDSARIMANSTKVMLLQPRWAKRRAPVGEDEVMGLHKPWMPGNYEEVD